MANFNDNFSKQASIYAKFRPSYPHELFDYLNSLTPQHQLAWDCGTGNGQSAIHLADFYDQVIATDPSEAQIQNAFHHDKVIYKVEPAEEPSLADASVDLITVAQAVHWFDFNRFLPSVKRILKKDGIIAIWAYGIPIVNPQIDALIKLFHNKKVGAYWPIETRSISMEYTDIPFPFREIEPPEFFIRKRFNLNDLMGHFLSWSATQRYIEKENQNPIEQLKTEILPLWGNESLTKEVCWKIILRVGKLAH